MAEQTLSGLAVSEYPINDPRRGDPPGKCPALIREPCSAQPRTLVDMAATGVAVACTAGLIALYFGWAVLVGFAALAAAYDYTQAVITRAGPAIELPRLATRHRGGTTLTLIQGTPAYAFLISMVATSWWTPRSGGGFLLVTAAVGTMYLFMRAIVGFPVYAAPADPPADAEPETAS